MSGFRCRVLLSSSCLMVACSQPATVGPTPAGRGATDGLAATSVVSAGAGSSLTATVQFGLASVGSSFNPTAGHDHSSSAKDSLFPQTVVIDRGGTVTFETFGVHGVAIYAPGKKPADVQTHPSTLALSEPGCPEVPLINDQTSLVAIRAQPCAGGSATPSYTFTAPGRYLVVCRFYPHFVQFNMYGWVNVR